MKTNLRQSLFSLASILLLAFVACTDVGTDMPVSPEKTAENRAHLFVSSDLMEEGAFRTIVPTDVTEEEITSVELYAFLPGTDTQVGIDGGYFNGDGNLTALQVMRSATNVYIEPGTYDFVLRLYDAWGFCCQKGVIQNKTVSADKENRLAFKTEYCFDGDGSVELYFTWTADQRISYVSAGLFTDESDGETAVSGYELGWCHMEGDDATGYTADYIKYDIAAGTYFIRYEAHAQNSAGEDVCLNAIEDVIRVVKGRVTKKTIALKDINTLYTISYGTMSDESGNSYWKEGFTALTDRNAAKAVLLPVAENVNRPGYQFDGWYESDDGGATLTGNAVTSIASGTARDVSLYAKWTHLAEFYVAESGRDDSGDGSELHPYATVGRALSEIDSLDNASHAYTVYVDGTVRGITQIDASKAASITISGTSSETAILSGDTDDDGTGDGTVVIVSTSVPVTLKNVTVTKGSSGSGGGLYIENGVNVTLTNVVVSDNMAEFGGGIWNKGTLTINGTTAITGNTASVSNGGGIYNEGILTITSGTVSKNIAQVQGGGIYNMVNCAFYIGGTACIASDNDVFLASGTSVALVEPVETSANRIAVITPQVYNEGDTVLTGSASLVKNNYTRFSVTPQSDGTEWGIAENGTLASQSGSATVTVTLPEYSDISVTKEQTGPLVVFTVAEGYTACAWTVDDALAENVSGVTVSGNGTVLSVDTTGWLKGNYDIVLTAVDADGLPCSFWTQVKLE